MYWVGLPNFELAPVARTVENPLQLVERAGLEADAGIEAPPKMGHPTEGLSLSVGRKAILTGRKGLRSRWVDVLNIREIDSYKIIYSEFGQYPNIAVFY